MPQRNPHMQAVFAAVAERAKVLKERREAEASRLAEELANQPEVVEVVLTEEELEQQRIEAEVLFAEKKRQAEERKAEKERLAQERAKFLALKQNLHQGIEGGVKLKKTRLPNKKRVRNNNFAGRSAARVEVDVPVHTSLVLAPDYQGRPLDLNDLIDEEGNWDNLEPLFAEIEEAEEQVEEKKKKKKSLSRSNSLIHGGVGPIIPLTG